MSRAPRAGLLRQRFGVEPARAESAISARVTDERIAPRHGVLGQQTAGAGGSSVATRSTPVLLGYGERLRQRSPDAWLLNFTNPAGLVAQGLAGAGRVSVCLPACRRTWL